MNLSSTANRPRHTGKKRLLICGAIAFTLCLLFIFLFDRKEKEPELMNSSLDEEPLTPASFTHEVRPILAKHCYSCHSGPKATPPRLDTGNVGKIFEALHKKRGGLGLPEDTIHQNMLNLRDTALLMRWHSEGAVHEPHWAFQPLPRDIVPPEEFQKSNWVNGDIDQFHLSHLAKMHLRPTPRADTLTLLRRISIDLTGEPPSLALLEESLRWEDTDQERHYQALVDEMITSNKFGETFAEMWFDIHSVRGHSEKESHTSPFSLWRNWVGGSLNKNLPIDEFIRQQISGNLENNDSNASDLPTTLFRIPLRQPKENLTAKQQLEANLQDRLYRLGEGFLGFSLLQSRSETPLSNPITSSDLKNLRTLFTAHGESGIHPPGHRPAAPTEIIRSPSAEVEISKTKAALEVLAEQIESNREQEQEQLEKWLEGLPRIPEIPDLVAAFHCDSPGEKLVNQALGEQGVRGSAPKVLVAPGVHLNALVLGGGAQASFHHLSPATPSQAWTLSCWIRLLDLDQHKTILFQRIPQAPQPGRFLLEYNQQTLRAGWERDGSSQSLLISAVLPFDLAREWAHLTWTCDGSGKAAGLQLYWNGQPLAQEVLADSLPIPVFHPEDQEPVLAGSEAPEDGSFLLDELHAHARALTPLEILHLADKTTLFQSFDDPVTYLRGLTDYYFSSISVNARALSVQQRVKRELLDTLSANPVEIPILKNIENTGSKTTSPLFAKLFPPTITREIKNRQDLANWMTEPDHPLTARVFVNHVWKHFFGEGLVPTTFGLEGAAAPEHKLLDWLARDFIEHGWNLKRLCRQIVFSNTYQQSRPEPPLQSPHKQLGIMLHISNLTETEKHEVLTRFHQPFLQFDWTLSSEQAQSPIPEDLLIKSSRRITKEMMLRAPDDHTMLRELFLRFRSQDENHPEFPLVMDLFELQKKNLTENDGEAPKLILGGGAKEENQDDLDPAEWGAWIEICTTLLNDQGIRRQR